jgi:hypothetical protein
MEQTLVSLAGQLSGPAGAMLLLAMVLYAVWKLANKVVDVFSGHLSSIEGKFDKLIDTLDKRAAKIENDLAEVQSDVNILKEQTRHIVVMVDKEK